ncbi:MAG: glycosyltransferase family 4 protein [Kiritimatiellae bacterium]|nr:glycosyltransferase family 4 protein [Kiritimatiellia bacterium]MCO5068251.1 glycosyltransferase family 4 protein [Kiritimatiellia bacterium]
MSAASSAILFLEKVFLRPPKLPLRGVELFNFRLIEDFLALGNSVALPCHRAWRGEIEARAFGANFRTIEVGSGELLSAWSIARRVPRHSIHALFLANVGNGLIPLLHVLRWRGAAKHLVLLAHREASPRFVRALKKWNPAVVGVNEQIARPFRAAGFSPVAVDYGIMNAERFVPAASHSSDRVRFVVLGALENAWKGADTALAAFGQLTPEIAARCELHLASYLNPPANLPAGVTAHPWMPIEKVPEFLRSMDVMICPSRDEEVMRETFSQAIVQGMLTGLPILASELAIFREKLDAGGGCIFRDASELALRMTELVNDASLRAYRGAAGRATALERYCWDTKRFMRRHMDFAKP